MYLIRILVHLVGTIGKELDLNIICHGNFDKLTDLFI
jgi:hypothetical protein